MAKKKYYVVWEGQKPGIYDSWTECQLQIKGYPGARYKSFTSREEAEEAYTGKPVDYIQRKAGGKKNFSATARANIIWDSIAVDAACSGNPGDMEYRGVDTKSGDEIFHVGPFRQGTNNVGEFLALVHALAYLNKIGDGQKPIYSDSKTAMSWGAPQSGKDEFTKDATQRKALYADQQGFDLVKK